jgi:ABC-type branched-subunit amino acid transport system ATPase component
VSHTGTAPTHRPDSASEPYDGLEIEHLRVSYHGHLAVDDLSLRAERGKIVGLVGPNGAGKTSTFNACSGLTTPGAGRLALFGRDITRLSVSARARAGLGRTFQRVEICPSLTVRTNVALGAEARLVGRSPIRHFYLPRPVRAAVDEAVSSALELCELGAIADAAASTLSTGHARRVELARVVAGGFSILLLDEPSSGLDEQETAQFGAMLAAVVRERHVGVLLVEHDMSLVTSLCDRVYVMDFGKLIFDGAPSAMRRDPAVRAAYLGQDGATA